MAEAKDYFLGRHYDLEAKKVTDQAVMFDPADLVTHAVILGMTGSGKTGMGVILLEEAALQGTPAIIVDPKGDLTNLLLHFPDQTPQDFEPWIDPDEARRSGKTVAEVAAETSARWQKGHAEWGLTREQRVALQTSVQYTVFTPGSSAGRPVSILSSFAAPQVSWEENREVLREKISSTVTALLGLVGMSDVDPLRSREHILLSNLLEHAWSQGRSLDLVELIMQVQTPPFERLGAFPLDHFFPQKERMDLAMLLNNFLASPSFQSWVEGDPLDVAAMLYMPDGRPRHSIFYLAHLTDSERMFFVTLLCAAVEAWARLQRGTSTLRAMFYFDEIFGYLPPISNPPSRPILLRMLKQMRAFGLGMVLATQNPVDLDYKALSNTGTWMIGRLQTERDKMRLLEGLQSASGLSDQQAYDRMISGLQKRVFLLHSVHMSKPETFSTRFTLNYLAGPMTRSQIPALQRMAGGLPAVTPSAPAAAAAPVSSTAAAPMPAAGTPTPVPTPAAAAANGQSPLGGVRYLSTRPAPPVGVEEFFALNEVGPGQALGGLNLPAQTAAEVQGMVYRPALLGQAEIRYLQRKFNLDTTQQVAVVVEQMEGMSPRWEQTVWTPFEDANLFRQPTPNTQFAPLPVWLSDPKRVKALQTDFLDWAYRSATINVRANETLKVYAGPEVTTAEFREMCAQAARALMDAELTKLEAAYEKKLDAVERKVARQKLEVEEQQNEVQQRTMEELGTHGELLLSLFAKRKRSVSSSLTKRRLTSQAKAALEQEREELKQLETELDQLEEMLQKEIKAVQDRWAQTVNDIREIPQAAQKKDVFMRWFGVVWMPYYLVKVGAEVREAPAFKPPQR